MSSKSRRWNSSQKFKTDEAISGNSAGNHRPLKKWVDDNPSNEFVDESLDSLSLNSGSGGSWDQFAVNREKFGIVTTYDERHYTTEVNKNHPDFAAREKLADEIAREIENDDSAGNIHLAEERGVGISASNVDDEDMYSGVVKENHKKNNSFGEQRRRQFAFNEAHRVMNSPDYFERRDRNDEAEDRNRFANQFPERRGSFTDSKKHTRGRTSSVSSESKNYSSKKTGESPPQTQFSKNTGPRKKKFDFSASAAKASTFTPPSTDFRKSPRSSSSVSPQSGVATMQLPPMHPHGVMPHMPSSPSMIPPGIPGMVPMMPRMQSPFYSAPSPFHMMMSMQNTGSSKSTSPLGSDLSSPEPTGIVKDTVPLGISFDFIAVLESKGEKPPPVYVTPPTWDTTATVSYMEQLPTIPFVAPQFTPWM